MVGTGQRRLQLNNKKTTRFHKIDTEERINKCIALPTTEFVKPYDTYQTYGGNLFEQVDKATTFTRENIKFIRQKGRIQRSEYVELCNCSPKTAYNDIQDLVKKDILIASGKGKRTYYMLRGFYIKAGGM